MDLKDITVIFNYCKDEEQLNLIMGLWAEMNPEKTLNFIVCNTGDDESVINVPKLVSYGFRVKVIKLDVYKPFNQPLGKNSSVKECETKWMLITDPDRVLPKETLNYLENIELQESYSYNFNDCNYDCVNKETYKTKPNQHHLNTFLLTRNYFEEIGGYNELFCGHYGHDDSEIRERMSIKRLPLYTYHVHVNDSRVRDCRRNTQMLQLGPDRQFVKDTGLYKVIYNGY